MMGQMLGPDGLYRLAKELQPRPRTPQRAKSGRPAALRVRIGSALIAAGTAIGGDQSTPVRPRPAAPIHHGATSPTA